MKLLDLPDVDPYERWLLRLVEDVNIMMERIAEDAEND